MGEDVSDMHRFSARSEHGNTLPELLVVLVLIGAMASIAVPLLLSYLPSATANYAARELQSGLNRAKLMAVTTRQARSEEHTSELQSLRHLVCRLLLEKKKQIQLSQH